MNILNYINLTKAVHKATKNEGKKIFKLQNKENCESCQKYHKDSKVRKGVSSGHFMDGNDPQGNESLEQLCSIDA